MAPQQWFDVQVFVHRCSTRHTFHLNAVSSHTLRGIPSSTLITASRILSRSSEFRLVPLPQSLGELAENALSRGNYKSLNLRPVNCKSSVSKV
jgi:hypothetical protein